MRIATLTRPGVRVGLAVLSVAALGVFLLFDGVRVTAAPEGGDPRCAEVLSRLPDDLPGAGRDWAPLGSGDGVATWGGRSAVLRCGVPEPSPTVDLCMTVDGVDWVLDERRLDADGVSVLTTYGRSPAVEVAYSGSRTEVGGILASVGPAVEWITPDRGCVGVGDVV
ncbi:MULTISPECIES: DUF3515 family protein [unclassified Streptomyces]|uniref:DUF3515 family protein n=1 Tax=unclassified Streptomyces TaxID=2593676 RepID=UPI001906E0F6|nr:DUF3515 family protein [Streptomyces sp. HSG2]